MHSPSFFYRSFCPAVSGTTPRTAGDFLEKASCRFSVVLPMEAAQARRSAATEESQGTDSGNASGQPDSGRATVADELNLKLGIHVAPRTIRKYLDSRQPRGCSRPALVYLRSKPRPGHRGLRFLRVDHRDVLTCTLNSPKRSYNIQVQI